MSDSIMRNVTNQAADTSLELQGIPEFVRGLFERLLTTSPTKEQVVLGAVGVGGTVALCAIRHGYDLEYDHQSKKLSIKRGK